MSITLDKVKEMYRFTICDILCGEEIISAGKCSQWARKKELKLEKDLIYINLKVSYLGTQPKNIVFKQFHLEDSEGYFSDAMPPQDYIEKIANFGDNVSGGLIFSVYQDVKLSRLWFDTGLFYDNSSDPILIDIVLPLDSSETRTQSLDKEYIRSYTRELAKSSINIPQNETKAVIKKISQECGVPYKRISNGYVLRILLEESRKQDVIINFSGKDEKGNDLVTIATICAPVKQGKNDHIFLKLNPKLPYGAIGISPIQGEDFYVITATYPASIFNEKIAVQAIEAIALKGDWLENKLTKGQDLH